MIDRLAINAKITPGQTGNSAAGAGEGYSKMVAIAAGAHVIMWGVRDEGSRTDIGNDGMWKQNLKKLSHDRA
jgi:hypothetical protein